MEEIISGEARTTEEHAKHHLTLEEQLARRKAKMAKLRSALLSQKREAYDKVLSENGIQTESQLREAMALYARFHGAGITMPGQLDKLIDCALQYAPDIIDAQTE